MGPAVSSYDDLGFTLIYFTARLLDLNIFYSESTGPFEIKFHIEYLFDENA